MLEIFGGLDYRRTCSKLLDAGRVGVGKRFESGGSSGGCGGRSQSIDSGRRATRPID